MGKPFLAYRQATVRTDTGQPAHAEVGYLRGVGGGRVELVLAHPTGIAELAAGDLRPETAGLRLHLRSTDVARTATAKEVRSVQRTIVVAGDLLRYELAMGRWASPTSTTWPPSCTASADRQPAERRAPRPWRLLAGDAADEDLGERLGHVAGREAAVDP